MSDPIRHDDLTAELPELEFPVLDEALAPIRKPVTTRTPRRETGDAFDRAFAALEEALKERDAALSRAMPKTTTPPAPVSYLQPQVAPTPTPVAAPAAPKMVEPQIMPETLVAAASPVFAAPSFERVAPPSAETVIANGLGRIDDILAAMQMAATEVVANLPNVTPAPVVETAVAAKAAVQQPVKPASKESAKPATDPDLMPFGAATCRLMVM